ncbi:MAG: hypothetical protein M3R59_01315 [Verrucomicrobiota bacterium]|nr:hypothetical protein [Verrucomicrobiota bacterium]
MNSTFITGLNNPVGIAIDNGRLYVGTFNDNTIAVYDANTGAPINTSFITGLTGGPGGILIYDGSLFVTNPLSNTVGKYDAATGAVVNASFITGLNSPQGIAEAGGNLYVMNVGSNSIGRYDSITGANLSGSLISGLTRPNSGITIAPDPVTFSPFGFIGTDNYSEVRSVTGDGRKYVGLSGTYTYPSGPFAPNMSPVLWTPDAGLQVLPYPPTDGTMGGRPFITASDISADGNWIAYRAKPGGDGHHEAMICAGDLSQTTALGRGTNVYSAATQISDDGANVFGFGYDSVAQPHSFHWTAANGYQQIAEPSGYNKSIPAARGVSSDGIVSIGDISNFDIDTFVESAHQAYRWTSADGLVQLGYLPGGDRSVALGLTRDGSQIFGISNSTTSPGDTYFGEWFLWSSGSGMTSLGKPIGYDNFSLFGGISSDGIILATAAYDSTATNPDTSFVYSTLTRTFYAIPELLAHSGAATSLQGWSALSSLGVSDDGNTLFGSGTDPNGLHQGWTAHFPDGFLAHVRNTAVISVSRIASGPSAGHFTFTRTTLPRATLDIQASNTPADFSTIGTATADENGFFQYDDAGAVGQTQRFYRAVLP